MIHDGNHHAKVFDSVSVGFSGFSSGRSENPRVVGSIPTPATIFSMSPYRSSSRKWLPQAMPVHPIELISKVSSKRQPVPDSIVVTQQAFYRFRATPCPYPRRTGG
jgi:hypothetical protein